MPPPFIYLSALISIRSDFLFLGVICAGNIHAAIIGSSFCIIVIISTIGSLDATLRPR